MSNNLRKDVGVSLRLSRPMAAQVEKMAKDSERPVSWQLRRLIALGLQASGVPVDPADR